MNKLYYFSKYSLIMILGFLIKYIGIPSIYSLPLILFTAYNYLALSNSIQKPLEKRKDIKYKSLLTPMIIYTTILNTILSYLSDVMFSSWLLLITINITQLLIMKPNYEKVEEDTQKYIDEYFKKNNTKE